MKFKTKNLNVLICIICSFSILCSAHVVEFYFSLYPCDLCIKQRIIHYIILFASILSFFLYTHSILKNLFNLFLPFLWMMSMILAFYHFGIENKLWVGFSSCSSNIEFDKSALDKILSKSPIRCDEAQFEIFQVSLAGWNGLISMMIFIILLYLLYKERKEFRWTRS